MKRAFSMVVSNKHLVMQTIKFQAVSSYNYSICKLMRGYWSYTNINALKAHVFQTNMLQTPAHTKISAYNRRKSYDRGNMPRFYGHLLIWQTKITAWHKTGFKSSNDAQNGTFHTHSWIKQIQFIITCESNCILSTVPRDHSEKTTSTVQA